MSDYPSVTIDSKRPPVALGGSRNRTVDDAKSSALLVTVLTMASTAIALYDLFLLAGNMS